jgi:hypothetical protein
MIDKTYNCLSLIDSAMMGVCVGGIAFLIFYIISERNKH